MRGDSVPDDARGTCAHERTPWLMAPNFQLRFWRVSLPFSHPVRLGAARRLSDMVALVHSATKLSAGPTATPRHTRCVRAAACATARLVGGGVRCLWISRLLPAANERGRCFPIPCNV